MVDVVKKSEVDSVEAAQASFEKQNATAKVSGGVNLDGGAKVRHGVCGRLPLEDINSRYPRDDLPKRQKLLGT